MTDKEREQIKEICDKLISTFMNTEKVINTFEYNKMATFTVGAGKFKVNIELINDEGKEFD